MIKDSSDIPVVGPMLRTIFGSRNERFVKRYTARVEAINALEPEISPLTDEEIRGKTEEFRRRFEAGESRTDLLVEVFAVAREAMDRAVGIRNIFNPELADAFDSSGLPEDVRTLYEQTKRKMEETPPAPAEGPYLGAAEQVPGWLQLDIPNQIYDAVREMHPESRPPFRARPFDVQLIGAMVLSQGKIAEMKTGEGKTIVAPLACYLAALEGLKCHVVTVNDYLVQRDRDWTAPVFYALGMTAGAIHPQHMQPEPLKREMYKCDVVYGTTSEFGFDYLRDNMKRSVDQQVQRRRDFAIVDEVDSTLIDEARTPLIISGPAFEDAPRYDLADRLARSLVEKQRPWQDRDDEVQATLRKIKGIEGDIRNARDKSKIPEMQQQLKELRSRLPDLEAERDRHVQYYEVEQDKKTAHVTHHGVEEAQREAGIGSFYIGENTDLPHLLQQAVRAHAVYQRDRDYVVMPLDNPQTGQKEPSVVIVDVNTGRLQIGRQWSDGLHQAIEAKEGVPIKQETQTIATVTIQNFFKMYKRLAGMTGTADTEAQEFHDIYGLDVVVIPTNKPVIRDDRNDLVFLSGKDKWESIVDDIKAYHDLGAPVLVGTTSVERSEMLSEMLSRKHTIKHEVLNAKQHEREASIILSAGSLGAVMIATNMAGRGTDIKLARVTRPELLEHWQRRGLAPRDLSTDATDEELRERIFRKIAPREIDVRKAEAESMDFEELELQLLRKWAEEHTWLDPRKFERLTAEDLRRALDEQGRFMLHRIRWVDNVEKLGGLHVIGTERHESRRIDNQLRGRSGRQGDRGSSRFFVSLEDDLMKMFAGETTMKILSRMGMKEGDAIEHPMLSKSVERAQRKVEERNFQIRKQILEYDEVMEHQRQDFYGLRQRALDGRDMKGLIFEYIDDSVYDAVDRYLDRDFPLECIAEHVREKLAVSIPTERLRGVDRDDIESRVRKIAREEARLEISLTIGEYLSEETGEDDRDYNGLANWAEQEFAAGLKPGDLREMSDREIEDVISEAADRSIERADLSGVHQFLDPDYRMARLASWAKNKFGFELDLERLAAFENREDVADYIIERAREAYRRREIEYPVSFVMEMTMSLMRQDPGEAASRLVRWANTRYGLDWDESVLRTRMPQQIMEDLQKASEEFVDSGAVEQAINEALGRPDDESLAEFFRERFDTPLPDRIKEAKDPDERETAIRAIVEGALRSEMVQFERYILLDVLDTAWKDHLRSMDQLRDSIGFRAFSQKDPRIEYKREGAQFFEDMKKTVRDRVTEYVFKLRLRPQMAQPGSAGAPPVTQGPPPKRRMDAPADMEQQAGGDATVVPGAAGAASAPPQPDGDGAEQGRDRYAGAAPVQRAAPATGVGASSISGPGIPGGGGGAQSPRAAAGQAASGAEASPAENPAPATPARQQRVGRNDPCPCGSGQKYKKCCGANAAE